MMCKEIIEEDGDKCRGESNAISYSTSVINTGYATKDCPKLYYVLSRFLGLRNRFVFECQEIVKRRNLVAL